ncbi:MAG: hypothetical protein F6K30_07670 [Cyanothece sp. SIO2G6]|nr:hypothetical protein [Cyanothece sp. SIO2G6]
MSTSTYLQIVAKVRRLCTMLSLQLPTHATAIASQIRNIQSIRRDLELIQARVRLLATQSWRLVQRDKYLNLDHLLGNLITEATNMALLAEEFTIDPEGSLSCLREVNYRKEIWIQDIQRLATPDIPLTPFPAAIASGQLQANIQQVDLSA